MIQKSLPDRAGFLYAFVKSVAGGRAENVEDQIINIATAQAGKILQ